MQDNDNISSTDSNADRLPSSGTRVIFRRLAIQTTVKLGLVIFIAEFIIMLVVMRLAGSTPAWVLSVVDAASMAIVVSPIIHLFNMHFIRKSMKMMRESHTQTIASESKSIPTLTRLAVISTCKLTALVFVAEFIIMYIIVYVKDIIPNWLEPWIDAGGLSLIVGPIIFFMIVRPLHTTIEKTINRLSTMNNQLQSQEGELRAALIEMEDQKNAIDQHLMVSTTNTQGIIIDCNDKMVEISGYSREELIGKNHRIIKSGKHSREFYATMWNTIKSGKVWRGIIKNQHKDGHYYWVNAAIIPHRDHTGNITKYTAVRNDITEQRELELRLRRKQHLLNETERVAGVGGWECDIRDLSMEWSDELYRILEIEDTNQIHIEDAGRQFCSDHVDEIRAALQRCMRDHTSWDMELPFTTAKGNNIWARLTGEPVIEDKKLIRIRGIFQNLTQQHKYQEQLQLANQTQAALNRLLEISISAGDEEELLTRSLQTILKVPFIGHQQMAAAFLKDDRTGDLIMRAQIDLHPQLIKKCRRISCGSCLCGQAAQTGEIQFSDYIDHHNNNRSDGMKSHGHYNVPIKIDNEILGVFAIYVDIGTRRSETTIQFLTSAAEVMAGALYHIASERERALLLDQFAEAKDAAEATSIELARKAEELKIASENAQAASLAKSEFLANMSHEIRTPMTAILGFTDLLFDPEYRRNGWEDAIRTIQRNGRHLLTIINDILDFSKIESGKFTLEKINVSIMDIVEQVLSLMRVRAREKGLQLMAEYRTPVPQSIRSDPTRIRQILMNLIGNAVKFTNEGEVRIIIGMQVKGDSKAIRFDISDTGIGMTPQQVATLFKPFTQADSSTTRKFGGTGLGLTISRRLAELLNGYIDVSSQPGKGSVFSLSIHVTVDENTPCIDPESVMQVEEKIKQSSLAPNEDEKENDNKRFKGQRILLAEDGPDNQRLIAFILEREGLCVEVAENGSIACEKAFAARDDGNPYAIILMDVQMPEMDGYTATRTLRENKYDGTIIALTAHAMESERRKCLDAGCDDFDSKPIKKEHLLNLIEKYLKLRKQPDTIAEGLPKAPN